MSLEGFEAIEDITAVEPRVNDSRGRRPVTEWWSRHMELKAFTILVAFIRELSIAVGCSDVGILKN